MRDPIFDPEMIKDFMHRRHNGKSPEHREIPVRQREEEDFNYCKHIAHSVPVETKGIKFNTLQIIIAMPIILLLSCGILVLMFLLAVCHIALLPPILIYDWWLRRKRILKKVSPKVHISRSLSSEES